MATFICCLRLLYCLSLVDLLREIGRLKPEIVEEVQEERWEQPVAAMPLSAWDRRYYRATSTTGSEVFLVRRVQGARWLVLQPDLTMKVLLTSHRRTSTSAPVVGVVYTAAPVITAAQKTVYGADCEVRIAAGNPGEELALYSPGAGVQQALWAQAVGMVTIWPGRVARALRWSLRTPWRFMALLCVI